MSGISRTPDVPYIGENVVREDGREKSTGSAQYATDVRLEDALTVKILRSPRPHARIRSLDVEAAQQVGGVEVVVTGQDYPDIFWGTFLRDQNIFAVDKVRFAGQPVAAVAGGDPDALTEALERIAIDYEDLPAVFDSHEAMEPGAPILHERLGDYQRNEAFIFPKPGTNICNHFRLHKGDVEKGFRKADILFEDAYEVPMVQHCPMEPHTCTALYEPCGRLNLWASTQGPHLVRRQVAEALGFELSRVRVMAPYCGGGFGGKISAIAELLASAVALKLPGRPVQLIFEREEEFGSSFVRQAFLCEYRTGVLKDGTLVARQVKLIWDAGAFGDYEASVCRTAGSNAAGPYRIPNVQIDSYCVYTNKPVAGAFRGFGVSEVCFGYEQQLDRIALEIGIDPLEIRLRNGFQEGNEHAMGQSLAGVGLAECLKKVREALGPLEPLPSADGGKTLRGRGIACMSKTTAGAAFADAEIEIQRDGSILLRTSAVEHGQGSHTILRQMAAAEMGCELSSVAVASIDTDFSPPTSQTSASKTTFFDGNAVRLAAADARRRILDKAAEALEADPADLSVEKGRIFSKGTPERGISIAEIAQGAETIRGRGSFRLEDATGMDPETGQGKRPAAYLMFAAQGAEVEVDVETGRFKVLRLVAAHDVGQAIHGQACEGQIEGALVQGLGTAMFEELQCEQGVLTNGNLGDYKIPCALDTPPLVPIIVEEPVPDGPWGAKGIGEPGLVPTAPAIGNALFAALGRPIKSLPFTPDKILSALGDPLKA